MTEAYPLQWPKGRPRTLHWKQERSRFRTSFTAAVSFVMEELRRLGASQQVVSTDVPLRRDGLPYASAKRVDDVGVAVYFMYKGKQTCFACDRWDKVEDNIYAIAKTIDAMRGIARWGTGDMLEAAFTGFASLPPPDDWRSVLGNASSFDEVEAKYKSLARSEHPDAGGSNERMAEINKARDAARAEFQSTH